MPEPGPDNFKHPISQDTRHWIGDQMQLIAMMHDLGGPDISLVDQERYRNDITGEIRRRALAGRAHGEVLFELVDLDVICQSAADELIGLRQIHKAHVQGKLATRAMQQLPAYKAFPRYLDEDPDLARQGFAAALARQEAHDANSPLPSAPAPGASKPSGTIKSFSAKTEQWLEKQVLAFALAQDMADKPCARVDEETYVCESAPGFRKNVLHAMQIGNLTIAMDEVDDLCRHAAAKALKLRQLKVAYAKGQMSRRKLRQTPEYRKYREYLEQAPAMAMLALNAHALIEALSERDKTKTN